MPLWRRDEPLHERLAREAGLPFGKEPPPHDTHPRWGEAGIHGVHRARRWDALVHLEAPDLAGEAARFAALPDGTLIVEEADERADLAPLAEALERELRPPYRAEAVKQQTGGWAVAGRAIDVVEVDEKVDGDEIELSVRGGERMLLVDGRPAFGSLRALERLGEEQADDYVVRGTRLDGDLWDVAVTPL